MSNSGNTLDITINGVTTTYTRANQIIDCGCVYLEYGVINNQYEVFAKGTVTYNGVEYTKGTRINYWAWNGSGTFIYNGTNEPPQPNTTEFYVKTSRRLFAQTDTDIILADSASTKSIGCLEWSYAYPNPYVTLKATKRLSHNGTVYNAGDTITQFVYNTTYSGGVFEEV